MANHELNPSDAPVVISGLFRRFGKKLALDNVTLTVPRGVVFGLVGENGAGKTTIIRHILGLLRAERGKVRVFGRDPVLQPEIVLARIGYLSEDRDLPNRMSIKELLRYTSAFYPNWDPHYAEELRKTFDLDPYAKVRTLSRGQRAQAGLLIALAYRPDLLLLDEPSAGLDAVVRRDILGAVIRTVADEGRTVLFSSHLLDEVERVSDRIAMIERGRIIIEGALDEVKESHRLLGFRLGHTPNTTPEIPGALSCEGRGREWTVVANGRMDEVQTALSQLGAEIVEERVPSLEEVFVARVRGARHTRGAR
jgi:ABC-2 type transport system ATP-binding protein